MNTTMQHRLHVRWIIRRDMAEVLQIESDSYERPWTEKDFNRALRQRNIIGKVAEERDAVLGYVIYELHQTKYHVLNIAVTPKRRREGAATRMIDKLKDHLSIHRRTRITLDVRETNVMAHLFFRANGFKATRVLRAFYEDTGEDAYQFEYAITYSRQSSRPSICTVIDGNARMSLAEKLCGVLALVAIVTVWIVLIAKYLF